MEKNVTQIDTGAMRALESYNWPGNVRELESVLKQALINATGTVITQDCLPEIRCFQELGESTCEQLNGKETRADQAAPGQLPRHDLAAFVEERIRSADGSLYADASAMMERYLLTRVLRETGGNQSVAARMLGITRGSLRNKIRSLGLSIDQVVSVSDKEPSIAAS